VAPTPHGDDASASAGGGDRHRSWCWQTATRIARHRGCPHHRNGITDRQFALGTPSRSTFEHRTTRRKRGLYDPREPGLVSSFPCSASHASARGTSSVRRTFVLDRSTVSTLLPILALVASGCFQDVADIDDDAAATDPATCSPGNETCMCFPNETCNAGLSCLSGLCVLAGGTSGTGLGLAAASDEMSNSNDSGTGDPAGASGTEGTSEAGDASTDEGDDSSDPSSDAGTTTTSTTGDPDLPLALIPNADGWIARHSNRFGFQGPWFTFAAAQGATIVPSEEERWVPDEAGAMCM